MKWEKKGLIYSPSGENGWRNNSFLTPTPFLLNDDIIRIYGSFRDEAGVGRIGYVDVEASNPSRVISISKDPVLDIGEPGMFDDNGVVPTCIIKQDDVIYMYYSGYNVGKRVRFLVFTGIAISKDNGETFVRHKKVPAMERAEGEELFRAIHSICYDNNHWKVFYGAGNHFIPGEKKTLPVYDIRLMLSNSLLDFSNISGKVVIPVDGENHRVGRPFVFKEDGMFKMFYGYGSEKMPYQLSYSESKDGFTWNKRDLNLSLSESGWDSEMMAYPAFVRYKERGYLFYNGNNYGRNGFGYAELIEDYEK